MSNKEELNRHRKSITNNNKETSLETSKLKESIMKLNVGIVTKESINSIKILRILVEDTIIDMMSHGKEKLVKKKMPLIGKWDNVNKTSVDLLLLMTLPEISSVNLLHSIPWINTSMITIWLELNINMTGNLRLSTIELIPTCPATKDTKFRKALHKSLLLLPSLNQLLNSTWRMSSPSWRISEIFKRSKLLKPINRKKMPPRIRWDKLLMSLSLEMNVRKRWKKILKERSSSSKSAWPSKSLIFSKGWVHSRKNSELILSSVQ